MNQVQEHERTRQCHTPASFNCFAKARGFLRLALLGTVLLFRLPLCGQEAAATVMAGTRLRVQFNNDVGTAISRANDRVEVHLLKAVEVGGPRGPAGGHSSFWARPRKGDKHTKSYPTIRLGFSRLTLPDGRSAPIQAWLADLGVSEYVDSEGAASTKPPTKGGDIGVPVATGAAGAGIGGIADGGKGAAIGAGVGTAVGVLSDVAAHVGQWNDFTLKKGRKAWLRLDQDLTLAPATPAPAPGAPESRKP